MTQNCVPVLNISMEDDMGKCTYSDQQIKPKFTVGDVLGLTSDLPIFIVEILGPFENNPLTREPASEPIHVVVNGDQTEQQGFDRSISLNYPTNTIGASASQTWSFFVLVELTDGKTFLCDPKMIVDPLCPQNRSERLS
ncbi:MAG: hypothetical protein AAGC60_25655 [Acidobacteriota bacterium]